MQNIEHIKQMSIWNLFVSIVNQSVSTTSCMFVYNSTWVRRSTAVYMCRFCQYRHLQWCYWSVSAALCWALKPLHIKCVCPQPHWNCIQQRTSHACSPTTVNTQYCPNTRLYKTHIICKIYVYVNHDNQTSKGPNSPCRKPCDHNLPAGLYSTKNSLPGFTTGPSAVGTHVTLM